MHLQLITSDPQLNHLHELMKEDFPINQLVPLGMLKRLVANKFFRVYELMVRNEVCGYAIVSPNEKENYIDIEYLAIFKDKRKRGYGLKLIQLVQKTVGIERIVLHVEDPHHSSSKALKQERENRIQFYQKAGFHLVDSLSITLAKTKLIPMVNWSVDEDQLKPMLKQFFNKAYGRIWCFFSLKIKKVNK